MSNFCDIVVPGFQDHVGRISHVSAVQIGNRRGPSLKPVQDAVHIQCNSHRLVAVICDGATGNTPNENEVGALYASKLVCDSLMHEGTINQLIDTVACDLLRKYHQMSDSDRNTKHKTTILGLVLDSDKYFIFGYGDGGYMINDEYVVIPTANTIECRYLSYAPPGSKFVNHRHGNITDIRHIAIMSDGFDDLPQSYDWSKRLATHFLNIGNYTEHSYSLSDRINQMIQRESNKPKFRNEFLGFERDRDDITIVSILRSCDTR